MKMYFAGFVNFGKSGFVNLVKSDFVLVLSI